MRERKGEREGNGKLSKAKKKQIKMNEWRENCLNILKNTYWKCWWWLYIIQHHNKLSSEEKMYKRPEANKRL